MKKIIPIAAALSIALTANAQTAEPTDSLAAFEPGITYLEPLFEYPTAPESIESFRDKCNWVVENFWNGLDTKGTSAVDQRKLDDAFKVFATSSQYADKAKVGVAVEKLYKSIQKNPTLLVQMTKAAEDNIYNPNAEYLIDELYADILRAALKQKKFPKSRSARYQRQLTQLDNSMLGQTPAMFDFKRANGDPARYFPMATPTLIFFGDPDCDDCRMAKLRMQSNVGFSKAVAEGRINVLYIIPDADEGWEAKVADVPAAWAAGASDTVADILDLRFSPDLYVIDGEGKIAAKHIGLAPAMNLILSLVSPAN